MFNFSSPPVLFPSRGVPHCLAPHDSSPFTAECFILPQLSLVVWQKNWKSTDYVYFQNRAYQSVIRPLRCSLLYLQLMIRVISVLSPRMCCFPSRQGYLEYCVWAMWVCVCVWDLFFKWYEWPFQTTTQSWDTRTQSLCLEQSKILRLAYISAFLLMCGDSSAEHCNRPWFVGRLTPVLSWFYNVYIKSILICRSRKSTGKSDYIYNGSLPLSVPISQHALYQGLL